MKKSAVKKTTNDVDLSSKKASKLEKVRWITFKRPGDLGLDPEAATGIAIAKATMEKTSKLSNISFGLPTPVPTGETKHHLLDDKNDDDYE